MQCERSLTVTITCDSLRRAKYRAFQDGRSYFKSITFMRKFLMQRGYALTCLRMYFLLVIGTVFLEVWKRKNAELAYKWDVDDFEEQVS